MKLSDLQYDLPKELIATKPASPRDSSKLMVIHRDTGEIEHRIFSELPDILNANYALVFNQTKVIPARLEGKKETGGKVEVLLVEQQSENLWKCLGKNLPNINNFIHFDDNSKAKIISKNGKYQKLKFFHDYEKFDEFLKANGQMPIPPYIRQKRTPERDSKGYLDDKTTYQTVYAQKGKSVAAPTAGLHFTNSLLKKLASKGIQKAFVDLEVGLGTFEPIKNENLLEHKMHSENFSLSLGVAQYLNGLKKNKTIIISVGTTTTRVLETCATDPGSESGMTLVPRSGSTDIFIYPPYKFKFVDGLLTNFHLPGSTLLALVYAFGDEKLIKKAYLEAVKHKYRFYSYGDAMLIL